LHNLITPKLSNDGYIRLSFVEIQAIGLTHLISELDQDAPTLRCDGAMATAITGYTEWISTTKPVITIGWDWQMDAPGKHVQLRRINEPRSNLMLCDADQVDAGPEKTIAALERLIDVLDWQSCVQTDLNTL
jgi:hypothetical protein